MPDGKSIILYDGDCCLCKHGVRYIAHRDPSERFAFATLQSPTGQRLLREHGYSTDVLDTLVLVDAGKAYDRSEATLRIAAELRGPTRALRHFLALPRVLRDPGYAFVAHIRRYLPVNEEEDCGLADPDIARRIMDR